VSDSEEPPASTAQELVGDQPVSAGSGGVQASVDDKENIRKDNARPKSAEQRKVLGERVNTAYDLAGRYSQK